MADAATSAAIAFADADADADADAGSDDTKLWVSVSWSGMGISPELTRNLHEERVIKGGQREQREREREREIREAGRQENAPEIVYR